MNMRGLLAALAAGWAAMAGMASAAEPLPQAAATENLSPVFAAAKKDFCIYNSALSPFVVVRNEGPKTRLFQQMADRSGPTQLAFVNEHKVTVFDASQTIDPKSMTESWMLFWFNGGKGWEQFDIPILVVLQKLPSEIKPGGTGVEFVFPGESGTFAIVPLYGLSMIKPETTAAWKKGLPDEVAARCRMLAEISREYPIEVQEKFKLFPQQDKVLIRDQFEFMSIDDDWKTPHKKIAPLEPAVALALRSKFRLLSVSGTVVDTDMPFANGVFAGVEGDECSYTLTAMLKYVNTFSMDERVDRPRVSAERWSALRKDRMACARGDAWAGFSGSQLDDWVVAVRESWLMGEDELHRLCCYAIARQLTSLWTREMAYPKWRIDRNVWWDGREGQPMPEMDCGPVQRFRKDRMGGKDYSPGAKYVSLWQNGTPPRPDVVFHMGRGIQQPGIAPYPLLLAQGNAQSWPSLSLAAWGVELKLLHLGGVTPAQDARIVAQTLQADVTMTIWAADYLKKQ